jgi:hypothetical protein
MTAPLYWDLLDVAYIARLRVETRANTPRFSYTYGAMNFRGRVEN